MTCINKSMTCMNQQGLLRIKTMTYMSQSIDLYESKPWLVWIKSMTCMHQQGFLRIKTMTCMSHSNGFYESKHWLVWVKALIFMEVPQKKNKTLLEERCLRATLPLGHSCRMYLLGNRSIWYTEALTRNRPFLFDVHSKMHISSINSDVTATVKILQSAFSPYQARRQGRREGGLHLNFFRTRKTYLSKK